MLCNPSFPAPPWDHQKPSTSEVQIFTNPYVRDCVNPVVPRPTSPCQQHKINTYCIIHSFHALFRTGLEECGRLFVANGTECLNGPEQNSEGNPIVVCLDICLVQVAYTPNIIWTQVSSSMCLVKTCCKYQKLLRKAPAVRSGHLTPRLVPPLPVSQLEQTNDLSAAAEVLKVCNDEVAIAGKHLRHQRGGSPPTSPETSG